MNGLRFDEEGLVKLTMEWLLRHRQTKGAETDKQFLMAIESQSFTLPVFCVTPFFVDLTPFFCEWIDVDYICANWNKVIGELIFTGTNVSAGEVS